MNSIFLSKKVKPRVRTGISTSRHLYVNTNSLLRHRNVVQTSITVPFNTITVRSVRQSQSPTPSLHGPYVNPRPLILRYYCAIGTSFSVPPPNLFTAASSTGPAAAWKCYTNSSVPVESCKKLVFIFSIQCAI